MGMGLGCRCPSPPPQNPMADLPRRARGGPSSLSMKAMKRARRASAPFGPWAVANVRSRPGIFLMAEGFSISAPLRNPKTPDPAARFLHKAVGRFMIRLSELGDGFVDKFHELRECLRIIFWPSEGSGRNDPRSSSHPLKPQHRENFGGRALEKCLTRDPI